MMPKLTTRKWVPELTAALFVLLFLYTALSKLKDYTGFVRVMLHSPLIAGISPVLAIVVPVTELLIVFFLVVPRTRSLGLVTGTLAMALFTSYVAYMLIVSSKLPCTCGGIFEHMTWQQHLIVNSLFLLLGISSVIIERKYFALINRRSRTPV